RPGGRRPPARRARGSRATSPDVLPPLALAGRLPVRNGRSALSRFGGLVLFAGQAPRSVLVFRAGAAFGPGLDGARVAALGGTRLFETPMSPFLHGPRLPDRVRPG